MDNQSRRNFVKKISLLGGGLAMGAHYSVFGGINATKSNHPVYAFTKCLQFMPVDQAAEVLARNGFNGADLTVRAGGIISPENVKKELPKAFDTFRKAGIDVDMIVTDINDPDHPDLKPVLHTMAAIGIRHYRMGYMDYDNKKTMPENLVAHKRSFEKLEKLNRAIGVTGNYQNHSGTKVGGPVWDLYELLKDCDPKYLGVQYDIRHATVEGGTSWPVGMKLLAPWIQTSAIKDFIWEKAEDGKWEIKNVPLGEGMVDFEKYFAMYKALKIKGPFTIHYEYDLGGAEHGKKETSMPQTTIESFMKKDLSFLMNKLEEYDL